jgi:signal transduction histidine kinase
MMAGPAKPPAKRTSQRRRRDMPATAEVPDSREAAAHREAVNGGDVRAELDALMAALREANGHLIVANLRSQTLAEQMNQLYEEARRAIEAKDEFFTVISHELRTPLTSITGWSELLKMDPDAATVAEAARAIASSAAVQAQLIDDLLDVSRIMTNKFAITKASIDLREVIDESVSGMRPLAATKDIALRKTVERSVIVDGIPRACVRCSRISSRTRSNSLPPAA